MFYDQRSSNGGMRPLPPPEEADIESSSNSTKEMKIQAHEVFKKPHNKNHTHNADIRDLTRSIDSFARNKNASAKDALKVIEESRGTIFKILKEKGNKRNKKNGRK